MARVWITYAWADNAAGDVEFIAQELTDAGLEVRIDRWELGAGRRLWEQIETFICDPAECDAWLWFATANSVASQPCKEELAWALDRALARRGDGFPLIALTQRPEDHELLPAAVRTRRYVQLTDPHWKERVVAAAEGRNLEIDRPRMDPYVITVRGPNQEAKYEIEMRPRIGVWTPFVVAIPLTDAPRVISNWKPEGISGPAPVFLPVSFGSDGKPFGMQIMMGVSSGVQDGWVWTRLQDEVTSYRSAFLTCQSLPSQIMFGPLGKLFVVALQNAPLPSVPVWRAIN